MELKITVALALLIAAQPLRAQFTYKTFKEWETHCKSTLPTFKSCYVKGTIALYPPGTFKRPEHHALYKGLTLDEFEKVLDTFFTVMRNSSLSNTTSWVAYGPTVEDNFFDTTLVTFKPYVQKLIVKPGVTVSFRGDLHADLHSLLGYIHLLQEKGYLDKHDGFTISDPNFYIVFLGDYVDRGIYGVEVLYTLMRLKIANPKQIIMVRGNHEDPFVTEHYGFKTEFDHKFKNAQNQARTKCYDKISKLYNFLPLALYLGSGTHKEKSFIQCCHGGLEIGFNPQNLFKAADTQEYQWLGKLNQKDACNLIAQQCPPIIHSSSFRNLENNSDNYVPSCPATADKTVGFMWNDFEPNPHGPLRYRCGRGFIFNKEFTEIALALASTDTHKLKGVFRAHQHTPQDSDPLMQLLLSSHGVARLWRNNKEIDFKLWDGIVCTFLLAPDNLYGSPTSQFAGIYYDTSALLTIAQNYNDWHVTIFNNNIYTHLSSNKDQELTTPQNAFVHDDNHNI
jgi:Calcineurin-like phosphoesterase